MQPPSQFSALPPADIRKASPKAISRRTSYLRVRLEFLRYPQVITGHCNVRVFGPPLRFTATSTCSWIGHPVSGLIHATMRTFHPRFPCGSVPSELNLAAYINSPDRSTKSTTSSLNALCVLVNIRFQVLFHSPPGVLFTFPSQYCSTIGHQVVFRLGEWSPHLPGGFLVSARTPDTARCLLVSLTGLSPSLVGFPTPFCYNSLMRYAVQNPANIATHGLASSDFARHYFRNRMFSFSSCGY